VSPLALRTDKGGENQQVARFMLNVREVSNPHINIPAVFVANDMPSTTNHNTHQTIYMDNSTENNIILFPSVVVGRSVHNERIERLWNDIFKDVTQFYKDLFEYIEMRYQIDFSSDLVAKYCLHYFFLVRINQSLERCKEAWNLHPIRTEKHKSPYQLQFYHGQKSFSQSLQELIPQFPSYDMGGNDGFVNYDDNDELDELDGHHNEGFEEGIEIEEVDDDYGLWNDGDTTSNAFVATATADNSNLDPEFQAQEEQVDRSFQFGSGVEVDTIPCPLNYPRFSFFRSHFHPFTLDVKDVGEMVVTFLHGLECMHRLYYEEWQEMIQLSTTTTNHH
jgi:hypothetical protein